MNPPDTPPDLPGNPTATPGTRDVEAALRESERRLRALLELSSDWYWVQDVRYRLTVRDGAILDRNGTPASADLGKTHWEIGYLNMREADWEAHRALLERREEFRNLLLLRRNSAGRMLWTRLSGRPLHDANGRFIGYHGTGHDATAEVEAEQAQRDSQERFRDWAEMASDWFWEQDTDFRFTSVSTNHIDRVPGLGREQVLGRTRWELPIDGVSPEQWAAHREALARRLPFDGFVYRSIDPRGQARWVIAYGKPVFDADGLFRGYRGTARDITARIDDEERLRDSERRLRALLELSSDWYWVQDENYRLVKREGAILERNGLSGTEYLGKTHWEIGYLGMTDADWAAHRAVLERREEFRGLLLGRHTPGGQLRWARLSGRPLYATDGRFIGYHGIGHGVTDQVVAEQALRDSESQLRLLTDSMPAAVAYIDRDLVLRFVNKGYTRIFSHRPGLVEGARLDEAIDSRTFETVRGHYARVMQGDAVTYRRADILPDGSRRIFTVSLVPHRSVEGSVLGCYAVTIDSSALDDAEAKIRVLERSFASALANTTDLMAMYRVEGQRFVIEQFNPALRAFYESRFPLVRIDDWIGRDIDEFLRVVSGLGQAAREARLAPFRKALRESMPVRYQIGIESPGGRQQRDSLLVPLAGATGAITHLFYRGADITDLVEKERELNRLNAGLEREVAERTAELSAANRELESFAYSVSHDLRTPLRGIDGFAQLLEESHGTALGPVGTGYLQRIRRGITRMGVLIDDMLRLTRVTRGPLKRESVDLSALAGEIAADLQRQAISRPAEWRLQPGVSVNADPGLMRLMLENLLGNAWKYTRDAATPVIEFGATAQSGGLELFIRDNGAGFDMAYADKLFKAFQRLHGPKEFEGTGIGLATVARVVERHGGTVRAQGEAGRGAAFYVLLPDQGAD